ncbi:MAG: T9SS type A sorting domain-containing protein [Ignavibacteriaceae bacterium]|nr:T9SS type A sorting domain-containing protein [Ignavibacteriaceae bacterium]
MIGRKIYALMFILLLVTIPVKANINLLAVLDTIPPVTPENVVGSGYEKHIDVDWYNNSESDLAGYKVYRKVSGQFTFYTNVSKEKSYISLNIGVTGITNEFKISAYDDSGNESPLSDSVVTTTHDMIDEEFLDMVQRATFRYFWDYAHPVSGLARERLGSGEIVTTGGSGFGVMALLVGIERGYVSREQGVDRMLTILNFLNSQADRFHGAFPHWMNGTNGNVIPFSQYDDGGDLVETSFMIQGLLTARQYFDQLNSQETEIRNLITQIWETVEWDWYRRSPFSDFLYWHWSPNYGWQMNFKLVGYNETMITYLLAIASQTHSVPANLYYDGWASSTGYFINQTYYGHKLWVGDPYGGPLFFAHYSFLGFDARYIRDNYCNYFLNNRHHTLINREYCIANPQGHTGYGPDTWGLTASDEPSGYSAHEPYVNDNGTITPTAALSSMPYTPTESISALKNFYRTYYANLWGEYGFKDAFNLNVNWFASSYLAIDQGPIIDMIENYRSNLLWEKFMENPEIQPMLDSIGFVPDSTVGIQDEKIPIDDFQIIGNYPNPFNPSTTIVFTLPKTDKVVISIYNVLGEEIIKLADREFISGKNEVTWYRTDQKVSAAESGIYFYTIKYQDRIQTGKMVLTK